MGLEVELKYRADGPGPLRVLSEAATIGPAALGVPRRVDEMDRYLDTTDGRFAAARWACRLRRREGTTRLSLKGPAEAVDGALHRRPEVEGPATDVVEPEAWPAGEASALVDRLRDGRPLVERLTLAQDRTERPVLVDGEAVGTLSLDVVRVSAGNRERGTFHAVELELAAGPAVAGEAALGELDAALRRVVGLRPDPRTKLEHALDLVGRP